MIASRPAGKETSQNVELRALDEDLHKLEFGSDPAKKSATAYDLRDMNALGLVPTFRRRFNFLAMLGFSSTVVVAWQTTLATFSFALFNGGTGGLFWTWIYCLVALTFVYLSLAELSSSFPTAGGQYQWVAECAPPSLRRLFSYCTGWLCTLAWTTFVAGCGVIVGNLIKYCIVLYYPNSVPFNSQWFPTLLAVGAIIAAALFNIFLASVFPLLEGIVLFVHLAGWAAVIVTLWVTSPRANARDVLLTFSNGGGWSSEGAATLIGVLTPLSALCGYDSSVHMTENARDASKTVPLSLLTSFACNGILAFTTVITMIFCLGDQEEVLSNPLQTPFLIVFTNSTKSKGAAVALTVPIIVCFMSALINEVATASRQLWSFSRDGGVPLAAYLANVHDAEVPRRAVWTTVGMALALCFVNFGPAVGFNAIISLTNVALLFSYLITISSVIWRRLAGTPLPKERFSLGSAGLPINILAWLCIAPLTALSVFPSVVNPTPALMNWAIVLFSGVILFAGGYYAVSGRKRFDPPMRKEGF
ncbi:hypothetical protein LTR97_008476 [Elasticomyces elasticus]|uniref:Amino acid permease/ SLC12A domain-containing protein n=1 Tax=Elasticomyces elasticus TaxID=574655 RepID=A0AAN7VYT3_9PEZI|nr:hypothetical protein LTR97_008476 [Elasticomyces elasticus]